EARHRDLDPRLPDHDGGGQVARVARQHGHAGAGVPVHEPLPAADAHAALRRVRAGSVSRTPRRRRVPVGTMRVSAPPAEGEWMAEYGTVAGAIEELARRGFAEPFRVVDGVLRAGGERVEPQHLVIREYHRFEG